MSTVKIPDTTFDCKLCGVKVSFNVNDPSSFLAISDEKKFAGMTLSTYRVTHRVEGENHTNAVTVDHKGFWRGYVDAYVDYEVRKVSSLHLFDETHEPLDSSVTFKFFIIFHLVEGWLIDVVCPPTLVPLRIGDNIVENLELIDTHLLEEGMLMKLDIAIGDRSFQTYLMGDQVISFIMADETKISLVDELFDQIFLSLSSKGSKSIDEGALISMVQILDFYPGDDLEADNLIRVFENGSVSNPLKIREPDKIPVVITSIVNQKSYPEHLTIALISLLSGQKTLVELIESGFLKDFQRIIEIMDFAKVKMQ